MKRFRQWLRVRLAYGLAFIPFWPAPRKKFVIFGQGRTGSTLLVDLIHSDENVHCDREIFNIFHFTGEKIKDPQRYIKGRSKRFFNKVYGFKVKIYQLRYDHQIGSVGNFLKALIKQGYQVVYLSRENVLQHAYSNVKRSLTGVTHVRGEKRSKEKISLPTSELLNEISLRLRFKAEELEALKEIPYLHLSYEKDLLHSEVHLLTVNKVRNYLNLQPIAEVKSKYQKITDKPLVDEITNYDEVINALKDKQLDSLIW